MNVPANPLTADLDEVLETNAPRVWESLRKSRIFVTGGTGFFGRWLLESFAHANRRLGLGAELVVLSRDPAAFATKAPHLGNDPSIAFVAGDVRDFEFPAGGFTHVIHAATEASAKLNAEQPLRMFETNVAGTRRVLEFAAHCGAGKFLLTSSGAVYGKQPGDLSHVPEDYPGGPNPTDPGSAYAEGKRAAEMLAILTANRHGFECKIARGFAFVGPFLPLETHFAIGNFLRDAVAGGPITVAGDGAPVRSYMYATDLCTWLWTILAEGRAGRAYNLGSEEAVSIAELAAAVAAQFDPQPEVRVERCPQPQQRQVLYVPSVQRAQGELGLRVRVSLTEALRRTVAWIRAARPV